MKDSVIPTWRTLSLQLGIKDHTLPKIAYNLLVGTFDEYIEKYLNPTCRYKGDTLYINNKRTKLTKTDIKVIIDCYVNDKSETSIKKLTNLYPNVKEDYIITVCDNYDKIPLKKSKKAYSFENNPQKRKEKGMC